MSTRRFSVLLVVALLGGALACSKKPPSEPDASAAVTAMPADVLGVAAVASPTVLLTSVGGYVDAIRPGTGRIMEPTMFGLVLGKALGVTRLDGIDWNRPTFVIGLDPKRFAKPLVLVVGVADEQQLRQSGPELAVKTGADRAVVGSKDAVEAVAAWALGPLAQTAAPKDLTFTLYAKALLDRYHDDLIAGVEKMKELMAAQGQGFATSILTTELRALVTIGKDTETVTATVSFADGTANLGFAVHPRPDTMVAKFVAAQKPAEFGLLARLPPAEGPPLYAFVGSYVAGPARASLVDFSLELFGAKDDADLRKRIDELLDLADGQLALTAWLDAKEGRLVMQTVYPVSDGAKVAALADGFVARLGTGKSFEFVGIKGTAAFEPNAAPGVTRVAVTLDTSALPAAQRELQNRLYGSAIELAYAAAPKGFVVALGPGAVARAELLRKDREPSELPAAVRAALTDATARKETFVAYMDMGPLLGGPTALPAPFMMGLGVIDGAIGLRIAIPAATVLNLVQNVRPH